MKFDSPLFDRIRVKPDEDRRLRTELPSCEWPGCAHAVARYQKDAVTGHRPTWKMGMLGGKRTGRSGSSRFFNEYGGADDPFGMFGELGGRARQADPREAERRAVRNAERKALHTLGLETDAERAEIKARFKELVKRHHPDANGGDRGSEDKLREIIEAYNYLKSAGYC